jgi:hypothetical protein
MDIPRARALCFIGAMKHTLLYVLLLAIPAAQGAPAPCASAEHRQFDFWIGDWRVHTPDGKLAGINRITREYGGCVIHEHYATGKGYSGESLNTYDASRKVWHQTWVDSDGLLLTLEGRWDGKSMVLEGLAPAPGGGTARQRIRWTPNSDGSVRQLWEAADEKGTWSVVFDGRYTRD